MMKVVGLGLSITGEIDKPEWLEFGQTLQRRLISNQFAIGDWVNYGERMNFGLDLVDLAQIFGWTSQTITVYRWVAEHVRIDVRRDDLSFKHHLCVAVLPPKEQALWLGRAADAGWSLSEMKRHIYGYGDLAPNKPIGSKLLVMAACANVEAFGKVTEFLTMAGVPWRRGNGLGDVRRLGKFQRRRQSTSRRG